MFHYPPFVVADDWEEEYYVPRVDDEMGEWENGGSLEESPPLELEEGGVDTES